MLENDSLANKLSTIDIVKKIEKTISELIISQPHIGYFMTLIDIRNSSDLSEHFVINSDVLWLNYDIVSLMALKDIRNEFIILYNNFIKNGNISDVLVEFILYGNNKSKLEYGSSAVDVTLFNVPATTRVFDDSVRLELDDLVKITNSTIRSNCTYENFFIAINIGRLLKNYVGYNNIPAELLECFEILPLHLQLIVFKMLPVKLLQSVIDGGFRKVAESIMHAVYDI